MPTFIAVLGAGLSPDGRSLDWESEARCQTALQRYHLEIEGKRQAFIVIAPGCHKNDRGECGISTMASLMAQWFEGKRVPAACLIMNYDERIIWGTFSEVS